MSKTNPASFTTGSVHQDGEPARVHHLRPGGLPRQALHRGPPRQPHRLPQKVQGQMGQQVLGLEYKYNL